MTCSFACKTLDAIYLERTTSIGYTCVTVKKVNAANMSYSELHQLKLSFFPSLVIVSAHSGMYKLESRTHQLHDRVNKFIYLL